MIRPSNLARVEACPISDSLSDSRGVIESSPAAEVGTGIHAFLADVCRVGRAAALARVPDDLRERCADIDLSRLPPLTPETAAVEVPLTLGGITGTADLVALDADGHVVVVDWKTGWGDVPPAAANIQLGWYALAAARRFGRTEAIVAIARVRESGAIWLDVAKHDAAGLRRIEDRVSAIVVAAQVAHDRGGRLAIGDHCRHCPAWRSCPAHVTLARIVGGEPDALIGSSEPMTAATVVRAHARLKAAQRIVDDAEKSIRTYVEMFGPIEADGARLAIVEETRETIDGDKAYPALVDTFGGDFARIACKITTSKTAIEDAIKPTAIKAGLKVAPMMRETMATLRARGAVKVATIKKLKRTVIYDALPDSADSVDPNGGGTAETPTNERNGADF